MNVGYIGNYYKIPEYIFHSIFNLSYVIVEKGYMSDDMFTFLKVRNIPYHEVASNDEMVKIIKGSGIDLWITCSYGKRITIEKIKDIEIYNIHYSALPNYKGRHPTFYATMANEDSIGISLHRVKERIDEGEIIKQYSVPYYIWEDENALFAKLTDQVPELINDLFTYLNNKESVIVTLNQEGHYFAPVQQKDYTISIIDDTPTEIYNKVRAQAKYRGALLNFNDEEYWVHNVVFSPEKIDGLLCVSKEDYYVCMSVEKR